MEDNYLELPLKDCKTCAHRSVCKFVDTLSAVVQNIQLPVDIYTIPCNEYVPDINIDEQWQDMAQPEDLMDGANIYAMLDMNLRQVEDSGQSTLVVLASVNTIQSLQQFLEEEGHPFRKDAQGLLKSLDTQYGEVDLRDANFEDGYIYLVSVDKEEQDE